MDAYVKTVLTLIAVCLMLQVAQGFGLAATPGQASASDPELADRYTLQANPMARVIFRFDRATGRTWTIPLQPQKKKSWTPIDEAPPEAMAPEEGEETRSRPGAAGGAEEQASG
jgi:hypothetical protein